MEYENFTYFVGDPLIQAIGRQEEKMLVAWPRALDRRVQSTQAILCQVRRTAATQQKSSPLRRQ